MPSPKLAPCTANCCYRCRCYAVQVGIPKVVAAQPEVITALALKSCRPRLPGCWTGPGSCRALHRFDHALTAGTTVTPVTIICEICGITFRLKLDVTCSVMLFIIGSR